MRRGITAAGTLTAAGALLALVLTSSPALAAAGAAGAPASAAPSAPLVPVAGSTSTGHVDPECKLSYIPDPKSKKWGVHISGFLRHHHHFDAVKLNAQVKCRRVSMDVKVYVIIRKTGLIVDHTVVQDTQRAPVGNWVKNQKTWKKCLNKTASTYYGHASGSVIFQGVRYSATLPDAPHVSLPCGT
jgi:hypothetical protein